jgi:hypothetical protein
LIQFQSDYSFLIYFDFIDGPSIKGWDKEFLILILFLPGFMFSVTIDTELAAILLRKTRMKYNKPIYIGATFLELSMY